ncbi:MAG: hypothetical protein R2685_07940 [Candidatus Nitrosocosmicus sp.]|nr:hypothetical protein [Candidatus Nitrosocosmicus sp.]
MSSIEPTPTIQQVLQTQSKIRNYSKLIPDVDNTSESIKLLKLEKKLAKNLLAILNYLIKKEKVKDPYNKPLITNLKRKYGFLFATALRSSIEDIYRLGGKYALTFNDGFLPTLSYYTTDRDLVLIRKYVKGYHDRIWFRIDKFLLNRVPEAPPIKGSFIIETLAAEIATYVMMEATKEKTRQVISILDRNNNDPFLTIESASSNDESSNRENYTTITQKESDTVGPRRSATITESAASSKISPQSPFGVEAITELLRIRGYTDLLEDSSFSLDLDPSAIDTEFLSTQLREKYYFVWATAKDDKVCKKYCRPLEGVFWKLGDLNLIPQPDLLTHPHCRCRIIRVRI